LAIFVAESDGIGVSSRNFRDFTLLAVGFLAQNFPGARSASVTNNECKDVDIFNKQMIKLKHILKQFCVCVSVAFVIILSLSSIAFDP
jgi:hypothetical protein